MLLGIPATWCGMPITSVGLLPLLYAVLVLRTNELDTRFVTRGEVAVGLLVLMFLVAWILASFESVSRISDRSSKQTNAWYGTMRFMFPLGLSKLGMVAGAFILPTAASMVCLRQ